MFESKHIEEFEVFKTKLTVGGIIVAFSSYLLLNDTLGNIFLSNSKLFQAFLNSFLSSLFETSTVVLMLSLVLGGFYLTQFNFFDKKLNLSLFNTTFDWSILFNLLVILIFMIVKGFQSDRFMGCYIVIFLISIFIINYLLKKKKLTI